MISIALRKEEWLTQSQRWLTALSWWCGDKRIQKRSRVERLVHIHNCAVKFRLRRAPQSLLGSFLVLLTKHTGCGKSTFPHPTIFSLPPLSAPVYGKNTTHARVCGAVTTGFTSALVPCSSHSHIITRFIYPRARDSLGCSVYLSPMAASSAALA